jgi:hypothetical protein
LLDKFRATVSTLGGPLALLQNPEALAQIAKNITDALPPAEVLLGVLSRLIRTAYVEELKSRKVPDAFMDLMRASGKFDSDEEITRFHRYCVESFL